MGGPCAWRTMGTQAYRRGPAHPETCQSKRVCMQTWPLGLEFLGLGMVHVLGVSMERQVCEGPLRGPGGEGQRYRRAPLGRVGRAGLDRSCLVL